MQEKQKELGAGGNAQLTQLPCREGCQLPVPVTRNKWIRKWKISPVSVPLSFHNPTHRVPTPGRRLGGLHKGSTRGTFRIGMRIMSNFSGQWAPAMLEIWGCCPCAFQWADSEPVHTLTLCPHSSCQDRDTLLTGRYLWQLLLTHPFSGLFQVLLFSLGKIWNCQVPLLHTSLYYVLMLFDYKSLSTGRRHRESSLNLYLICGDKKQQVKQRNLCWELWWHHTKSKILRINDIVSTHPMFIQDRTAQQYTFSITITVSQPESTMFFKEPFACAC